MSDLLPCPFCGNSATIYHDTSSDHERQWTWGVNCDDWGDCGASITGAASRDAVIAVWNRRHRTSVYAHRNGETEAPTVPGKYWFLGQRIHGDVVIEERCAVDLIDGEINPFAYYTTSADPVWVGQWWGPVVPPWEGAQ